MSVKDFLERREQGIQMKMEAIKREATLEALRSVLSKHTRLA